MADELEWIEAEPGIIVPRSKPKPKPQSPAAAALESALTSPKVPVRGDASHKIQETGIAPSTGLASASDKEEAQQHAGPFEQTKQHFREQKIEFEYAELKQQLDNVPQVIGKNGFPDHAFRQKLGEVLVKNKDGSINLVATIEVRDNILKGYEWEKEHGGKYGPNRLNK